MSQIQICSIWKTEKRIWIFIFIFQKSGFWSLISLDNFIQYKTLISGEWQVSIFWRTDSIHVQKSYVPLIIRKWMLLLNAISHVERGQDPNRTIVVLKKKKFLAIYSQVRNSGRRRGFSNNWVQMGNSMSLKQTCLKWYY